MSSVPPANPKHLWRLAFFAVTVAILGVMALYWTTAVGMVTIWYRSETFTHAFVVPPIALWLVWRRRDELAQLTPRPEPLVLIPMVGMALMWLLGDLAAVNSVTQLAFVAMLVLTVPALLGFRVAYALLFPLFFLFFAVPIGEFLTPLFMLWTADFTVAALRLSGIPVLREGLQFVIPSGSWSVVEACSGIRYLIASVTVGALFAHLNFQSTGRRVAFILVSFLVPVIANWFRAYMIVMMGHLSGNTLAVGVDHLIYGWVFFGVVIMLMFVVGARWSEPEPPLKRDVPLGVATVKLPSNSSFVLAAGLVLVMTVWPVGAGWWIDAHAAPGVATMSAPARLSPGWQLKAQPTLIFKPHFVNPSAEINANYGDGQQEVGLYLGFYRHQDYDRKLVTSSNVLVTSNDRSWSTVATGTRAAPLITGHVPVRAAELRRLEGVAPDEVDRLVVWQIYWINGTLTTSDYVAKVYSALYRLLGQGDDSAVVIVYAEKARTGAADVPLEAFMKANFGSIDALLRQTKATR